MDILSRFPDDVISINISDNNIIGSIDFSRFTKLEKLICVRNKITQLNNLPISLKNIYWCCNKPIQIDDISNLSLTLCCHNHENNIEILQKLYPTLNISRCTYLHPS